MRSQLAGKLAMVAWVVAAAFAVSEVSAQPAAGTAPTVAEVEKCMQANVPEALQVREVVLASTDKPGAERTIQGRLFAKRESGLLRSMMRIDQPADLRGAAYLLREGEPDKQDEMYVYLPALNKTRRIVGGSQDGALFGTDISYADIKQLHNAVVGGTTSIEKMEPYEGMESVVLMLTPDPAQESKFSQIRSWVDRKTCVVVKADFIAEGQVSKRYSASPADITVDGGYHYLKRATMEDLLTGSRTRIELSGVKPVEDIANSFFNPRMFQLGN
jgi:outer membrane lipoprotein-sorting protein